MGSSCATGIWLELTWLLWRFRAGRSSELFQDLAALLKALRSQKERREVSRTAQAHGKYRWRQGYKLDQVKREASVIRRILIGTWAKAFARQTPAFVDETRSAAEQHIHEAVDDIVADSAEQYMEESKRP